jgi:hypothetical protein
MRRDGRVRITRVDGEGYGLHIDAPWRGTVTVALPAVNGLPFLVHRIPGKWVIEAGRLHGDRVVARVRRLSVFGDLAKVVKCVRTGNVAGAARCLIALGVTKLPEGLFKQTIGKLFDYDACKPMTITNFTISVFDLLTACPAGEPDKPQSQTPAPVNGTSLPSNPTSTPASATAPETPTPTSPTPTSPSPEAPAPATSWTYHVTGTCRDGKCGLNLRSGPGYSAYTVTRVVLDGTPLSIVCQARGETVSNGYASSSVWDKLADGAWASDFYLDTPNIDQFTPPIPQC